MLCGQPSHGLQLCFPLLLHAGGRTSDSMGFRLKDLSNDYMGGA